MIKMKMSCAVGLVIGCIAVCLAHTEAEEDAFVDVLVEVYQGAPENSDCIEDEDAEPEPWMFTTMDSLLSCSIGERETGASWTLEDRRIAFDHYMSRMALKDRRQMSEDEILTCIFAFNICERFGYTNCLAAAKAVILSEFAPERDSAAKFYFRQIEPSMEATDTAIFVITNTSDFAKGDRFGALSDYCQKVVRLPPMSTVFTNALERFVSSRSQHRLYGPLDELLLASDPSYASSTNRYLLATEALHYVYPSSQNARHFQSITNRLGRALAPQVD